MTDSDPKPPKVFISYAHESDEHAARVLAFADQLVRNGLDVILDQYNPVPKEGGPAWMQNGLNNADYVLLICSPAYYRRVMRKEAPGIGLGAQWEGAAIYNSLYNNNLQGHKYIPVVLSGYATADVPDMVKHHHRFPIAAFDLDHPGYQDLYRHLTGQPKVVRPGSRTNRPPAKHWSRSGVTGHAQASRRCRRRSNGRSGQAAAWTRG
jgi:hypothetical protein